MSQNTSKINADELFQELLNETHDPLKIGSLEYLAGDALRKLDSLLSDGELTELDGEYYWTSDI